MERGNQIYSIAERYNLKKILGFFVLFFYILVLFLCEKFLRKMYEN
jgi:hypothetical protein